MVLKSAADSVGGMDQTNLSLPQVSSCKVRAERTLAFGFFLASFVSFAGSPHESNHLLLTISTVASSVVTSSAWSQLDLVAVNLID